MRNIIYIGLVSFFADISTEMVYPILPLFLTATLGATPAIVGIIEGIAESLASLLKVFSGYISDKYKKKKPIAFLGYSTGIIYKILLIIASSWVGILFARIIDRIGKGIRTSPRDVLIYESSNDNQIGKSYGIHKTLDMAGTSIGILTAFLLLSKSEIASNYDNIFYISIIPAILSLVMFSFIKEKKVAKKPLKKNEPFFKNFKLLDKQLKLYLLVSFIFTLGNSSNAFLLLRAQTLGFSDVNIILLYFVFSITASLFALPIGKKSDQIGRKKILVSGYCIFSIVYFGFAFAANQPIIIALFVLYGLYTAMISGIERAYIAEIAPKKLKGTMLGLQSTIVGLSLLPASIIAGFLWTTFGVAIPFIFGATMSLIAALMLVLFMEESKPS